MTQETSYTIIFGDDQAPFRHGYTVRIDRADPRAPTIDVLDASGDSQLRGPQTLTAVGQNDSLWLVDWEHSGVIWRFDVAFMSPNPPLTDWISGLVRPRGDQQLTGPERQGVWGAEVDG